METTPELVLDEAKKNQNSLEKEEIQYAINYSFINYKHEISMVKRKRIALNTSDDKKRSIDRHNSVPWGFSRSS